MVDARPQFAIMRKNSILSSVSIQQSAAWGKTTSLRIDKVDPRPNTTIDYRSQLDWTRGS